MRRRQVKEQYSGKLPSDKRLRSAGCSHICSKHRETCLWRRPYKEHFVSAAVPLPRLTLSFMECVPRRGNRVGTERWAASRILLLPCCRGQRRHVTRPRPSGYGTEPLGSTANGDQLRCAAIVFNPQNNDLQGFGTASDIL